MSKNNPVISDEAVEAAARLLWAKDSELINEKRPSWDESANLPVWSAIQEDTRQDARELLEAAAPYIAAEAWDEAAASIIDEHGNPIVPTNTPNPYRSQA